MLLWGPGGMAPEGSSLYSQVGSWSHIDPGRWAAWMEVSGSAFELCRS